MRRAARSAAGVIVLLLLGVVLKASFGLWVALAAAAGLWLALSEWGVKRLPRFVVRRRQTGGGLSIDVLPPVRWGARRLRRETEIWALDVHRFRANPTYVSKEELHKGIQSVLSAQPHARQATFEQLAEGWNREDEQTRQKLEPELWAQALDLIEQYRRREMLPADEADALASQTAIQQFPGTPHPSKMDRLGPTAERLEELARDL